MQFIQTIQYILLFLWICTISYWGQEHSLRPLPSYQQSALIEAKLQDEELNKLIHKEGQSTLVRESALRMSDTINRSQAYQIGFILNTQVPQYLTERHTLAQQGKLFKISPKNLGKNIFSYALTVAGIGAGTSILKDYSETGQIRPHKALDFLQDSNFFKTTAGIFLGSTALTMAGHFLPPGVGPILKTVPGFLGAALGFEWSQGNLHNVDWVKIGLSSLVSSAAFVALGSGGILAIAGGIAASMLSDQIYDLIQDKVVAKESDPFTISQPSYLDWETQSTLNSNSPQKLANPSSESSLISEYERRQMLLEIQNNAAMNNQDATRLLLESLPAKP